MKSYYLDQAGNGTTIKELLDDGSLGFFTVISNATNVKIDRQPDIGGFTGFRVYNGNNLDMTFPVDSGRAYYVAGTLYDPAANYTAFATAVQAVFPKANAAAGTGAVNPDLSSYAPLNSPNFSGSPTSPTLQPTDNSKKLANAAFVQAVVASLVGSSPVTLTGFKASYLFDSYGVLGLPQAGLLNKGLIITTDAISGTTIAARGGNGMVDRIDSVLAGNPDVVFLGSGTNDWAASVVLGTIASTDRTEFYGALKEIHQKVIARSIVIKKQIRLISINMLPRGSTARADYNSQENFAEAMIEVADYYSQPYFDAFHKAGFSPEILNYFTDDYIHPNANGASVYSTFIANEFYKLFVYKIFPNVATAPATAPPAATPPATNTGVTNQAIDWTAHLTGGASYSGGALSSNGHSNWTAGSSGDYRIVSGNGGVSIPMQSITPSLLFGLSNQNQVGKADSYKDFQFSIYSTVNSYQVFEQGTSVFSGNHNGNPQHSFDIKVEDGTGGTKAIKYYVDGSLVYTSSKTVAYPLIPTATFSEDTGTPVTITNATISGNVQIN